MPELQEDQLREFYAAIMESGKEVTEERPMIKGPSTGLGREERRRVVEGMAGRLLSPSDQAGPSTLPATLPRTYDTVGKVIEKLRSLDKGVEAEGEGTGPCRVSLGLVSRREWEVLLEETTRAGTADEAESLLELMSVSDSFRPDGESWLGSELTEQSHGLPPVEPQVTRVMERYAVEGRVTDVARLHESMKLGKYLGI